VAGNTIHINSRHISDRMAFLCCFRCHHVINMVVTTYTEAGCKIMELSTRHSAMTNFSLLMKEDMLDIMLYLLSVWIVTQASKVTWLSTRMLRNSAALRFSLVATLLFSLLHLTFERSGYESHSASSLTGFDVSISSKFCPQKILH
jgi:hypothetical protein